MSVLDELEFMFFHFLPYAPLPDGYKQADSLWVDYPNSDLRVFDDAGHLLLDESDAAVLAVAEFCA